MKVEIFSSNVITDKRLRSLRNSASSSDESLAVVQQAFESNQEQLKGGHEDRLLTLRMAEKVEVNSRDEVEVKAKLFLNDFDFSNAERAVNRICEDMGRLT